MQIPPKKFTNTERMAELHKWMTLNGQTVVALAAKCQCSPATISNILTGKRAPAIRIEQLVYFGVPRELLPEGCITHIPSMRTVPINTLKS
ncbi:helix-turn-helix domain-containing protein [Desulfobaculum bizertense]|uniref:helix-turn-helix domain-containing protein n=1 Tax=Desulfobaculum bizertense TaxID=376490 RepID=UPI001F1E8FC0|nr:helix-turn-helix transcriptional regulator [Desulfobaculum bizertense]UIJ36906.1 helix-turn-helix domain-containing protein [Desulfobaculum bizertense]